MYLVFVKHYLNEDGMNYFNKTWYPAVTEAISKQSGFISITTEKDQKDSKCVHIMLKFENKKTLDDWAKTELHDSLVDKLDDYRVRHWEFATKDHGEEKIDLSKCGLEWTNVTPRHIAYAQRRASL
jgi:hypothetical protein